MMIGFAQQSQLAGNYAAQSNVAVPQGAPAPTLTRAISQLDDLNKRLAQLTSGIQNIAQTVGGPFPVRGDKEVAAQPPESAMQSLNSKIDNAHNWISDIEGAQEAIRRSLGG